MESNEQNAISHHSYEVLIIGSGLSGICQAVKLIGNDIHDFLILEKENSLGGTWRDNIYLGAACDVPSTLYSYSFELDETNWHSDYSSQSDILEYINTIADKYHIQKYLKCNQQVERLEYLEQEGRWKVSCKNDIVYSAKFVITAVGQLHHPKIPTLKGADMFLGDILHTARFTKNHDSKYFQGKNVAVIGNGASSVQLVPKLQKLCKNVYLFHRAANHIVPRVGMLNKTSEKCINKFSIMKRLYRWYLEELPELVLFNAIAGKTWAVFAMNLMFYFNLKRYVKDEQLRRILTPTHPIGAKRVLFNQDFYPAITQPNVHVVTSPVQRLSEKGIVCNDGSKIDMVDVIVFATGFITNPFLYGIEAFGRNGEQLWRDSGRYHTLMGLCTHGFPNLFFLYGPNTNTGHSSVISMVEEQSDFIIGAISQVRKNNYIAIEVKKEAQNKFVKEVDERAQHLAFTKIRSSWYLSKDGYFNNNWMGTLREYRQRLRTLSLKEAFYFHDGQMNVDSDVSHKKNV
ncbi:hypothetical protein CTEN210_12553 [Chaetoceros tenuissimus]|uniref:Flavin-containing monooxygenase n=1 Tax=Chaetoceros tenuissimus TaxID=426638 RepID=A0AAD3D1V6_9STRA|nr:hypothetical protein CTEN210_12553 [Chaetoceros tenuissimus]